MLISKENMETTLEKMIQSPLLQQAHYAHFTQRAKDLLSQLTEKEFRIAVVGEFSAGKSTFLNALIGKDILPRSHMVTTATVTYIKNVPVTDPLCNKVKVEFFGDKGPVILELTEDATGFSQYVMTLEQDSAVFEEVASVTIYVDFPFTDVPIVLVDTPGIDCISPRHYERICDEIQCADISIYLFCVTRLARVNFAMSELLKQYQSSFLFVMNRIDLLMESEDEAIALNSKEIKHQLAEIFVENNPTIIVISALLALSARDETAQPRFMRRAGPLTAERRKTLFQQSNFKQIEDEIWQRLATSDKEKKKCETIEQLFESLLNEIIMEFKKQLNEIGIHLDLAQQAKEDNANLTLQAENESLQKELAHVKKQLEQQASAQPTVASQIQIVPAVEDDAEQIDDGIFGMLMNNPEEVKRDTEHMATVTAAPITNENQPQPGAIRVVTEENEINFDELLINRPE